MKVNDDELDRAAYTQIDSDHNVLIIVIEGSFTRTFEEFSSFLFCGFFL